MACPGGRGCVLKTHFPEIYIVNEIIDDPCYAVWRHQLIKGRDHHLVMVDWFIYIWHIKHLRKDPLNCFHFTTYGIKNLCFLSYFVYFIQFSRCSLYL